MVNAAELRDEFLAVFSEIREEIDIVGWSVIDLDDGSDPFVLFETNSGDGGRAFFNVATRRISVEM